MARPCRCRRVFGRPPWSLFQPAGESWETVGQIVLTLDELEALRLADLEGLYQEQAAERMNVSRQTFGRIVESARKKVAQALVEGKALRIEGGVVEVVPMRKFLCYDCKKEWEVPYGTGRPEVCPQCGSRNIHRTAQDRGGWGGGQGRSRCRRGRRGPALTGPAQPAQDQERKEA